jgi:hypothetical protein
MVGNVYNKKYQKLVLADPLLLHTHAQADDVSN